MSLSSVFVSINSQLALQVLNTPNIHQLVVNCVCLLAAEHAANCELA